MSDRPEGSTPDAPSAEWLNGFGMGMRQGVLTGLVNAAEICRDLVEIIPDSLTAPEALRDASMAICTIAHDVERACIPPVNGRAG